MNRLHVAASATLVTLAAVGQCGQSSPGKTVFTVRGTGLAFDVPSTWKVQNLKMEQRVTIPTSDKHDPAIMHFYTVDFRYKTTEWQDTQVTVANEFKRTVDRQWQEDVLGIPLVLTKTSGVDSHGVPDVVLTGLLYSATKNKMLFRLTCSANAFDEANTAWHEAFQSLRTTDGSTPKADDPNKKLTPDELEAKPAAPLPVTSLGTTVRTAKLFKGPVVVPGTAGGKAARIRLPTGWSVRTVKDSVWQISSHDLSGAVTMTLASTLDSDPVDAAVLKASGASLAEFVTVSDRTDVASRQNEAGGFVSAVYRVGKSATGPLTSFDGAVNSGDLYVLFHWEATSALTSAQQRALQELLELSTIDSAP